MPLVVGARQQVIHPVVDLPALTIDLFGDDEDGRRRAHPHQRRHRVFVDIAIPIVEGERGDRARKRLAAFDVRADFVDRHELEMAADPRRVAFEHGSADQQRRHVGGRSAIEVLDDTVVANHQRRQPPAAGASDVSGRVREIAEATASFRQTTPAGGTFESHGLLGKRRRASALMPRSASTVRRCSRPPRWAGTAQSARAAASRWPRAPCKVPRRRAGRIQAPSSIAA